MQNFQDECESKMKVLEEAAESAKKMSCHNEADDKVTALKVTTLHLYPGGLGAIIENTIMRKLN